MTFAIYQTSPADNLSIFKASLSPTGIYAY